MKNVAVIAFGALKELTSGYMKLDIYDGLLQKGESIKIVDAQEIPKNGHNRPLLRNGVVECDISLMPFVGDRDCPIVALNNAVGEPYYTREAMATFQPAFEKGDMPVKLLVRAISHGQSPYEGKVIKTLAKSYDVFMRTSGIYIVCATLVRKDNTKQSHMIMFDANRDIVCFGMDDEGFEQITFLIQTPDRADVDAAKQNLLSHFPKLKSIDVTFVIQMYVKLKALRYTHEPAYIVIDDNQEGKKRRSHDDDTSNKKAKTSDLVHEKRQKELNSQAAQACPEEALAVDQEGEDHKEEKEGDIKVSNESMLQPAAKKPKISDSDLVQSLVPEERQKQLNAQACQAGPQIIDAVPA